MSAIMAHARREDKDKEVVGVVEWQSVVMVMLAGAPGRKCKR